jgi:DNA invertase Pin-like site-specific DNA recombinase
VVKVYEDQGISAAKGRDQRPAFDALLKAAVRREINMIAVWSSDRLGRSLKHLVEVLEIIRDTGTGLHIHTQAVDPPAAPCSACSASSPSSNAR